MFFSFSLKAKQNHKLFFACGHHTSKDSFSCISKRWVHFCEYVNWTYQIRSGKICDVSCNAPKVFNVWIKCYQYVGYKLLSLHKSHTRKWILIISLKYIFQVKKVYISCWYINKWNQVAIFTENLVPCLHPFCPWLSLTTGSILLLFSVQTPIFSQCGCPSSQVITTDPLVSLFLLASLD